MTRSTARSLRCGSRLVGGRFERGAPGVNELLIANKDREAKSSATTSSQNGLPQGVSRQGCVAGDVLVHVIGYNIQTRLQVNKCHLMTISHPRPGRSRHASRASSRASRTALGLPVIAISVPLSSVIVNITPPGRGASCVSALFLVSLAVFDSSSYRAPPVLTSGTFRFRSRYIPSADWCRLFVFCSGGMIGEYRLSLWPDLLFSWNFPSNSKRCFITCVSAQ